MSDGTFLIAEWRYLAMLSYEIDASVLEHFFVPAAGGKQVSLSDVATFEATTGPLSVAHSGQMASVTISFNLAPNISLGAATTEVQNVARAILPATITGGFSGTAQAFQSSLQGMGILLLLHTLDLLDFDRVVRFWPVLLIAAGVYLLYGRFTGRDTAAGEARNERP